MLPHLLSCFDHAFRADLAVAFILRSGVRLLRAHLRDLLDRGGRVRILTGDYLDVTDPDALVELLDLEGDLQLRVFEAGTMSFHPKSYLFHNTDGGGRAFVGSSNLSHSSLDGGVEWNYRVLRSDADQGFANIVTAFEDLFANSRTRPVDEAWIAAYRNRRHPTSLTRVVEVVVEPATSIPEPHAIQREALSALTATRKAGNEAGLVVLATGLGKTWLAAFDSDQAEFRRVLFVAHRDEILTQAMHTFRSIRPLARLGRYTGQEKSFDSDVLFASIQTLGRVQHLNRFSPDAFDYIVVDEFHHAAARTYRQLIEHFSPRFLLGLTATPERMDGGDLLALCQENLIYRKDVVAGIESGLLCPFRYFGVPDDIDYSNIPWRSTRFDEVELTKALATIRRAQNALEQFRKRGGTRALGFCCSQKHADFMADYFRDAGVRAVAVHAGETSAPRASALAALAEGRIDIVFAVDMFNEGLDIPTIDTVLMLRPTESSIVWMQQFGRGLRQAEGKSALTVVDYIGNHRSFLVKVRAILQPVIGSVKNDAEISAAIKLLQQGRAELPTGCSVTYDLQAIDIIQSLLRTRAADDAILAFYKDFRERHGIRPTAVELYHSGYNPRSLRRTHGSWMKFVRTMGDLCPLEQRVVETVSDFLEVVETMPMTKSFKMLTLLAMLNRDALPGEIAINDLAQEFRRVARRSETLRADVGISLEQDSDLQKLIEKNPVGAWCGAKGTGDRPFFRGDDGNFRSDFAVAAELRGDFQHLVRELVDWRLAEYLDRGEDLENGRFICRVLQTQRRPRLKLPSREKTFGIPLGWVNVSINDAPHVANFAKEYVDVIRREADSAENFLSEILQGWFGPDAGQPGTQFQVVFESTGERLRMLPVGSIGAIPMAESWRHYMREDIPPLFGLEFNTGSWNQGFVAAGKHVFLLVTLEKGGLNKDHRYGDRFVSPELFQWQSQNRTKRASTHGRLIQNHRTTGTLVHLFVRKSKLVDGKAAPFVYGGELEFDKWDGDAPITVDWRLKEGVPNTLWKTLDVPAN